MSAEKMARNETLLRNAAGQMCQRPVLTCGSCRTARVVKCCTLEERAQDRLQAQRACGFRVFNIPIKSLMPVDNERKHGGVAEPIRRFTSDINAKRKGKELAN
jgi:hypothetical protein